MDVPENLQYTASHEWIADHGYGTVSVGITAVAVDQLGELVYWSCPVSVDSLALGSQAIIHRPHAGPFSRNRARGAKRG